MKNSPPAPSRALAELATALDRGIAENATPDEALALIRRADELTVLSQARLHELVTAARSNGIAWQSIGDTLGVSRQAAFKRFKTLDAQTSEEGEIMQPTIDLLDRTTQTFHSLEAGKYDEVKAMMTYACSRALTKSKIMGVWNQVVTATGSLETCENTTVQTPDGRNTLDKLANRYLLNGAIVQTTLRHEAGEWIGRVAYNGSGKITGILIAPPGAQNLPF